MISLIIFHDCFRFVFILVKQVIIIFTLGDVQKIVEFVPILLIFNTMFRGIIVHLETIQFIFMFDRFAQPICQPRFSVTIRQFNSFDQKTLVI